MILSIPAFFATLLSALQTYFPDQVDPSSRTRNTPQSEVARTYDFIIVGAGSAGCVLANRLSENPNWTVLLIEAGGNDNYISDTPFLAEFLLNTEMDWNYTTVREEGACLMNRGRVIGGTSTINDLIYVRGNRQDYDDWEALGNQGWSYKDVLPYFIKAENMTERSLANSKYHGTRGPLTVQYSRFVTPLRDDYVKAGIELGWHFGDYNAKNQSVSGYQQTNLNGPLRENTARAYLNPTRSRKNLDIIMNSFVTRVIIENNVAIGVEYFRDGNNHTVLATKEVILSAGTVDTAKLLMLSGIGPRKELEKHNIDVILDLPVGSHYVDHDDVIVTYELNDAPTVTPSVWRTNESIMAYAMNGEGPLTLAPLGCETLSFYNPQSSEKPPSLETMHCTTGSIVSDADGNRNILRFVILNIEPYSVGNVTLMSNDFRDPPVIQQNMFQDHRDRDNLEEGVMRLNRLMETETMSKYSPRIYEEGMPDCAGRTGSDFAKCAVEYYSIPGGHCIGTAKMGPRFQPDSVISSEDLVVKGMKGLRIIDGSIMPTLPRANTNAVIIMLAERGADIIKNYYRI
ncbi:unnamed protein product [Nezara viridula]|uniref:Glucose-methanol-choline oxidoreductase N-terminal domain-containing protein n=1 Tax=Nezara viridula TaxID=85310 RepID=A0A9P0MQG1_NEZVI|nr:unnamed protein product [Nezara viridula]